MSNLNKNINASDNPFEHWLFAVKRSFDYKGRSSRKEFWMFLVSSIIFDFLIILLFGKNSIINSVWYLFSMFPYIALMIRRFHDVDESGWLTLVYYGSFLLSLTLVGLYVYEAYEAKESDFIFYFILLVLFTICFVVSLWFSIILAFEKGTPGPNKYGPNPIEDIIE